MLVANRSKDEVDYTSEITSLLNQFPANTNVLVVDTNFTNLLNIKGIMRQQYDYQVTIETDAEKALAFLTSCKHDINIVIWDYHMPKIDGLQALKSIASKMDLPVMIMSDDNQTESVMKAIVHGACEYVLKPVQEDVIANLWQHIVRKKVMSKRNISPPVQSDLAQSDGSRQRKVDSKIVDQEQNIGKKEESGEKRPLITWNRELQRVQSDLLQINVFNQHNDYHKTRNQDSCEQNIGKKEERVETRPWMTWNKANQPFQFNPVQINGLAQQNYYSKTINQDKGEQSIERAAKKPCMRAEEKELVHTDDSNNGDSVEIIDKRVWKKTRKQRMTWTKDLHKKFLEAIEINGGIEKANPKVLLDCLQGMKIQGLTRNNVASHLQKHRIYLEEKQIPKQTQIIGWSTEYVAAPSLQGPNNVHTGISQYVRNGPALNPIHQNQYQNGAVNPIQHNQYLNGAVNPIQQNQYQNGEVNLIQQKQYQNEIVNPIQQSQYQMGVVNPIQQKQYQNGAVNPMKQNQYQNGALNSIQQNDLNRAVNPIQQNNEYQKGYLAMNKNLFITNPSLPHVSYFDNQPRQPQQQQSSSQFNYLTSNEELGKASNIYALDPQLTYPSLSYM